jgi:hypothetical protein
MRSFAKFCSSSAAKRVVALMLGLGAVACSDDPAAPTADGIKWKLTLASGAGAGGMVHDPAEDVTKYKVRCSKQENGWTLEVEDPGRELPATEVVNNVSKLVSERTHSILTITGVSPTSQCTVKVQEGLVSAGLVTYTGACGTDCTFTTSTPTGGYDFQGALICNSLHQNAATFTLNNGAGGPILFNLSNCN